MRVLRELLLILRYRVELYTSTEVEWVLQAKVSGIFTIFHNLFKGSLGNLGDFEEVLSDCVELSELATIMCAEVVNDVKRNQVIAVLSIKFILV